MKQFPLEERDRENNVVVQHSKTHPGNDKE
jgi:hypothetical protein